MLPDRVSNPGPLTYESGALPIALRGPAYHDVSSYELHHKRSFSFCEMELNTVVNITDDNYRKCNHEDAGKRLFCSGFLSSLSTRDANS